MTTKKNAVKVAHTATPVVGINKQNVVKLAPVAVPVGNKVILKTVFAFKTRPAIVPKGIQTGTFISAINEESAEIGKEFNRVVTKVKLEAQDANGTQFELEKKYNILGGGRGFKSFITDINAWSGAELTEDDLYTERDFTEEFGGQPLVIEVGHRKVGKEWEAFIVAFHPAGYTGEVEAAAVEA
jgi:hypothetical protein